MINLIIDYFCKMWHVAHYTKGKAPFDQNFCPLSLEGEPLKNHGHRAQHAI